MWIRRQNNRENSVDLIIQMPWSMLTTDEGMAKVHPYHGAYGLYPGDILRDISSVTGGTYKDVEIIGTFSYVKGVMVIRALDEDSQERCLNRTGVSALEYHIIKQIDNSKIQRRYSKEYIKTHFVMEEYNDEEDI